MTQDKNSTSSNSILNAFILPVARQTAANLLYMGRGGEYALKRIGEAALNAVDGVSDFPGALCRNLHGILFLSTVTVAVTIPSVAWVLTTYRTTGTGEREPAETLCRDLGGVVRPSDWNASAGRTLPGGNKCYLKTDPPSIVD
jgi:hypothetical protein